MSSLQYTVTCSLGMLFFFEIASFAFSRRKKKTHEKPFSDILVLMFRLKTVFSFRVWLDLLRFFDGFSIISIKHAHFDLFFINFHHIAKLLHRESNNKWLRATKPTNQTHTSTSIDPINVFQPLFSYFVFWFILPNGSGRAMSDATLCTHPCNCVTTVFASIRFGMQWKTSLRSEKVQFLSTIHIACDCSRSLIHMCDV